jgi:hypothetical protein
MHGVPVAFLQSAKIPLFVFQKEEARRLKEIRRQEEISFAAEISCNVKEFKDEQARKRQSQKAWQANELARQREDLLVEQRKRCESEAITTLQNQP